MDTGSISISPSRCWGVRKEHYRQADEVSRNKAPKDCGWGKYSVEPVEVLRVKGSSASRKQEYKNLISTLHFGVAVELERWGSYDLLSPLDSQSLRSGYLDAAKSWVSAP